MNEQNNNKLAVKNHNSNTFKKTKKQNWVNEWLNQTAIFNGNNEKHFDSKLNHEYLLNFQFYLN